MPPAKKKMKRQCGSFMPWVAFPGVRCHQDRGHGKDHWHKSIRVFGNVKVVVNVTWRRI